MDRFKELGEGIPRRLCHPLQFILEINRLKRLLLRSYVIDNDRHENSAEHSWHLAVAAMVLAEHAKEEIDVSKVIRLVLVHDLFEIDAGDTFIYDEAANAGKAPRDQQAANRLFGLLPEDQAESFMALWREFVDGHTS